MKKIALITLRNDYLCERKERRDSIDVEIYSFLRGIGLIPFLIPNDSELIKNIDILFDYKNIECVLLSGGNDLEELKNKGGKNIYVKRDKIEINLIEYCSKNKIPIIGICRGFQMIAQYLGANLEKVEGHVNTIHEVNVKNMRYAWLILLFLELLAT